MDANTTGVERGCVELDEISRSNAKESCVLWRYRDVAEQP